MGMWQTMKRIINGEPVFQAGDQASNQAGPEKQPPPDSSSTPVNSSGHKIIPEIDIPTINCDHNGTSFDMWITVKNTSAVAVFLDKIYFLGRTVELDAELSPGGSRQYRIYNGPVFKARPQQYADVDYRLVSSGDYFRARFFAEFDYQSDGCYYPEDLTLQKPIRDI